MINSTRSYPKIHICWGCLGFWILWECCRLSLWHCKSISPLVIQYIFIISLKLQYLEYYNSYTALNKTGIPVPTNQDSAKILLHKYSLFKGNLKRNISFQGTSTSDDWMDKVVGKKQNKQNESQQNENPFTEFNCFFYSDPLPHEGCLDIIAWFGVHYWPLL